MIGRSLPRVEDGPLLTGRGVFVDDLPVDGVLHVAFLRSPFAHARIQAIDLSAARAVPGVVAVLAAADLDLDTLHPPLENPDAFSPPRPMLAGDRVRFVGEPVALAAATSRYVAEDALELVGVDYEPLPIASDIRAALAEHAPRLHEHPTNVLFTMAVDSGGVDEAFAEAAATVERSFVNPRYCASPIEPRGVLAVPDAGGVEVWASSQAPHRYQTILVELLGVEPDQVRVRVPDVGGGFGQKAHVYPEEVLVPWLALRLGRPVKWIEDRTENLLASSHARGQELTVRAAADAEGRLLALDADVLCDQGAFGMFPHGPILEALGTPLMIPGPYRVGAYRARARTVSTNRCPEGAYRGVGLPVAALVHERLMDELARELGLDRAEIRRRNLYRADELPVTTLTRQRYDSGDYPRALDAALDAIGYASFPARRDAAREDGRLLGLGISSYVEYTGINSFVFKLRGMVGILGFDGARLELREDGGLDLWTTLPTNGQGLHTTFAQLVAQSVGVEPAVVDVHRPDTGVGGLSGTGTFASRSAIAGGGAIQAAAAELRARLLEDAATRLESSPDDLELAAGAVRIVGSSRAIPLVELAAGAGDRYRISEHYDPLAVAYPYATHACIVEVDAETGGVAIQRYVVVEDCGTLINPAIAEGQTHGATAQGIGGTLFEEIVYDADAQVLTGSFADYLLPTASDLPDFEVSHLEIPAPDSPFGAKGVGEGGTLAPPGAIANAVADALGVELNELPLTPERVWVAAARERR
jgi:carbon-monoxide dehydrogenase large subunit